MTVSTQLRAALEDCAGIMETTTPAEVVGYLEKGHVNAAMECLTQSALLQESCMNPGRADALYALVTKVHRAAVAQGV